MGCVRPPPRRFSKALAAIAAAGALLSCIATTARSATVPTPAQPASAPAPAATLDAQKLEHALSERLLRVEEFRFIRQACEQLKIRCWLFGGTAAGYGHYVKWDLLRESGDPRFQPDRFDYDYTNIFRSTQDADLVIDGPAEAAARLESLLAKEFPHLQGSKPVWEVRLLRAARGDKEALLHNPDFLGQHTDSNSTGMIEVTRPVADESAVRDLRDWTPARGKRPQFFEDIRQGKLHYYFSKTHDLTSRAKQGLNPPILSVVRYLTKAFQYELEVRPEDWRVIERLAEAFDPAQDLSNRYVGRWMEKNGKKLIQHAVNIEYAWNTLERLGLRQKLVAAGDPRKLDSLAWWLNREPLRTAPLGREGRTARELGLHVVGHETGNFLAYESITRAHTGDPNVLVSRSDGWGEAAAHGDGFYAAVGRKGAAGTGLTIRFEVAPDAREGVDFVRARPDRAAVQEGDYIVFGNKSALRVIPESLNFTPLQFIEFLASGNSPNHSDRGIMETLRRRIAAKSHRTTPAELERMAAVIGKVGRTITEPPKLANTFAAVLEFAKHRGAQAYLPSQKDLLLQFFGQATDSPALPGQPRKLSLHPWSASPRWYAHLSSLTEILPAGKTLTDAETRELGQALYRRNETGLGPRDNDSSRETIRIFTTFAERGEEMLNALSRITRQNAAPVLQRVAAADALASAFPTDKRAHDAVLSFDATVRSQGQNSDFIDARAEAGRVKFKLTTDDPRVAQQIAMARDECDSWDAYKAFLHRHPQVELTFIDAPELAFLVSKSEAEPALRKRYLRGLSNQAINVDTVLSWAGLRRSMSIHDPDVIRILRQRLPEMQRAMMAPEARRLFKYKMKEIFDAGAALRDPALLRKLDLGDFELVKELFFWGTSDFQKLLIDELMHSPRYRLSHWAARAIVGNSDLLWPEAREHFLTRYPGIRKLLWIGEGGRLGLKNYQYSCIHGLLQKLLPRRLF